MNLSGRCACGDVRYQIVDEPLFTQACHCTDCQRTTGSAFVIHLVVCETDLKITGDTRMGVGPSGSDAGCELHACASCGVIVWARYRYHRVPVVAVRAGTLDDTQAVVPQAHIFVSRKLPWVRLADDVAVFSEAADRNEVWPEASIARYESLPGIDLDRH